VAKKSVISHYSGEWPRQYLNELANWRHMACISSNQQAANGGDAGISGDISHVGMTWQRQLNVAMYQQRRLSSACRRISLNNGGSHLGESISSSKYRRNVIISSRNGVSAA